jgi:hypothetical protein
VGSKKKTQNLVDPARAVVLQNQYNFERCHEDFMESLQNVKIKTRKGEKDRPAMQCLTHQVPFVGFHLSLRFRWTCRVLRVAKINRANAARSRGFLPSAKVTKRTLVSWWLDPRYSQEGDMLGLYHGIRRFPFSSLLHRFPSLQTYLQPPA